MVITWIGITLLGVASIAAIFRPPLWSLLGMLGTALTMFFIVDLLVHLSPVFTGIFWIIWAIAVVFVTWRGFKIWNSRQFTRTALPVYSIVILAILVGIFGFAGATMSLPLPGGGVKNLAVMGSLETQNIPRNEAYYKAIVAKWCANGVRYFANEAELGTNNTGPAIVAKTVDAAVYRWDVKKTCDPVWLAHTVHGIKKGEKLVQTDVMDDAKLYLANPDARLAAMQFVDEEVKEFKLVDAGAVPYKTLGMIPGKTPEEMPTLTKFSRQTTLGWTLVAITRSYGHRHFRMICDEQFSTKEEFEQVPLPLTWEKPPTKPPTTLTTPPSTSTTTTTVTTTTTPNTETTQTTPSTTSSTTTTTTGSSTTTTTPPSSTTTTSTTGSTTSTTTTTGTTTTTTPGTSTTTTTSTKGDVTYPTGKPPVGSPPGSPEPTAPVQTSPANPATTPGQAEPGPTAPGATQEPTQEPKPTVLPTGVPTETSAPGTGIPNPDVVLTSETQQMGMPFISVVLLLGAMWFTTRREKLQRKKRDS